MATILTGIRACVFDAYGTLFDYASAAASCRDVLGEHLGPLTTLWRDKQLQYTWLRAVQGRHADFWRVTGDDDGPASARPYPRKTRSGGSGLRRGDPRLPGCR